MMSLFLYLAVLLVSLSSVLFGLGWLSAPEPHYAPPPAQVASHAPAPAQQAVVSPVVPVKPAAPPAPEPAVAAASAAAPAPQTVAKTNTEPEAAPQAAPSAEQANAAPSTEAAAPAPPACDVAACERAYFTFRASDCTYQPSHGPRRLCTKGTPPQKAASAVDNARAQATPAQACNIGACEAAYRSFDPRDCTYQPSYGPRRLCSK